VDLDLKKLYNVLYWHKNKNEKLDGQHVGLFIIAPDYIANQFPKEGRAGEDSSPAHITLLYIGSLPAAFEPRMKEVLEDICDNTKRFTVALGSPRTFKNDKIVLHSPIKSKKLKALHEIIKAKFHLAQIPFDNKFPEFKPHMTIAYCEDKKQLELYKDVNPQGEWVVDSIWLWGTDDPHMFFLK
jgi:2'-5' RNA ligase